MKRNTKNDYAISKGYPSWDAMYDWTSREGERPEVVAQLTEAHTFGVVEYACNNLLGQSFEGWSEDEIKGYKTALGSIKNL